MARCEGLAHDEAEPIIALLAPGNLRRKSQELLVDETPGVKVSQQLRPSLDEDPAAGTRPAHFVEYRLGRDRAGRATNRPDFNRIRRALPPQSLRTQGGCNDQRPHLAGCENRQAQIEPAAAA